MPRPKRKDLEPMILLVDRRDAQTYLSNRYGRMFKVNPSVHRSEFIANISITDIGWAEIRRLFNSDPPLDLRVVMTMAMNCDYAVSKPTITREGDLAVEDGMVIHRLTHVGCRVHLTQEAIAKQSDRSRSHVNEQIELMREHGIIVNWGKGWYEFSSLYVWRGPTELRLAYNEVQGDYDRSADRAITCGSAASRQGS